MGKQTQVPLPHRQATNKTLLFTKYAPAAAAQPPHVYVRSIRASLQMTQEQLARRAGVAKSHVALVESGKANVGVDTLKKIFDAMLCDLLVVPKARKSRRRRSPSASSSGSWSRAGTKSGDLGIESN